MSDILPFDSSGDVFEQCGRMNGGAFWSAREFMTMLGYETYDAFRQAINKAIATCVTLGIPVEENFRGITAAGGQPDYKLSRFACYLVAMNGDGRKPCVALAQAYLASLAEAAHQYMRAAHAHEVERVMIRDDISERERALASTAKHAGVDNYAYFQNAGYRGMYNMNLSQLRLLKRVPGSRSPLDFMDKRELAGNLFRITETEAKLQAQGAQSQRVAENIATNVGKRIRKIMIENTGTPPEAIPPAGDIRDVKKGLKETHREFRKLPPKARRAAPGDDGTPT